MATIIKAEGQKPMCEDSMQGKIGCLKTATKGGGGDSEGQEVHNKW